jgi:hypothetical protein
MRNVRVAPGVPVDPPGAGLAAAAPPTAGRRRVPREAAQNRLNA